MWARGPPGSEPSPRLEQRPQETTTFESSPPTGMDLANIKEPNVVPADADKADVSAPAASGLVDHVLIRPSAAALETAGEILDEIVLASASGGPREELTPANFPELASELENHEQIYEPLDDDDEDDALAPAPSEPAPLGRVAAAAEAVRRSEDEPNRLRLQDEDAGGDAIVNKDIRVVGGGVSAARATIMPNVDVTGVFDDVVVGVEGGGKGGGDAQNLSIFGSPIEGVESESDTDLRGSPKPTAAALEGARGERVDDFELAEPVPVLSSAEEQRLRSEAHNRMLQAAFGAPPEVRVDDSSYGAARGPAVSGDGLLGAPAGPGAPAPASSRRPEKTWPSGYPPVPPHGAPGFASKTPDYGTPLPTPSASVEGEKTPDPLLVDEGAIDWLIGTGTFASSKNTFKRFF